MGKLFLVGNVSKIINFINEITNDFFPWRLLHNDAMKAFTDELPCVGPYSVSAEVEDEGPFSSAR